MVVLGIDIGGAQIRAGAQVRFRADENATPMSYTQGAESSAFGPGWVAV